MAKWDGAKAAESIFSHAGFDGAKPDSTFARKGFLVFDDSAPLKRESYRFPFAEVVNGRLVASAAGIRAALAELEQSNLPDDVAAKARAVVESYEAKMPKEPVVNKRGLYEVARLSYLLGEVGWIKACVDYEEEAEGDEASTAPANLLAAMQALGKALVEMTVEEVNELLANFDESAEEENERAFAAAMTRSAKVFKRAKLNKTDRSAMESMHEHASRTARLAQKHAEGGEDNDDAAVIHDRCVQMVDMLRGHIDARTAEEEPAATEEPKEEPEAPKERTAEERKAAAEQLRKADIQRRAKELIYGR